MPYAETGGSRFGFTTIGVASVQVVPFNINRKQLVICNTSANDVYLMKGDGPAVLTAGLLLRSGGTLVIEPDTLGFIWKGALYAISGGAGRVLSWTEDW